MTLHLIYFAGLRDLLAKGFEDLSVPFETGTVSDLVSVLVERYPHITMEGVRIAVNEEFAEETTPLSEGDVVAFIPPVSGG